MFTHFRIRALMLVVCLVGACESVNAQSNPHSEFRPFLNCSWLEADGKTFTASFGYDNFTTADINIPLGANNVLSPQPTGVSSERTYFPRGRVAAYFNANFLLQSDGAGKFKTASWSTTYAGKTVVIVADPNSPKACPKPVTTTLDCVFNRADGSSNPLDGYFGYKNENPVTVEIPVGNQNGFTNYFEVGYGYYEPISGNRNQPTSFAPGEHKGIFHTPFTQGLHWAVQYDGTGLICSSGDTACIPLSPSVECVDFNANGTLTAHFSYRNDNPFPIEIAAGTGNGIGAAYGNLGQPTLFQAGTHVNVFSVSFDPTTAPSLVWTLNGVSVAASTSSKNCNPNLLPICKASAKSVSTKATTAEAFACQGKTTTIALDGKESKDPEFKALSYLWSTDCTSSSLTNPTSAIATLSLTTPGTGVGQQCNVKLTVSDGLSSSSCPVTIQVPGCALDCLKEPNGSAKLDRCGICNGNGLSCLNCATTEMPPLQLNMDGRAFDQKAQIKKITASGVRLQKGKKTVVRRLKKIAAEADRLYTEAWTHAWSYPATIFSCQNTSFCSQVDNFAAASSFQTVSQGLKELALQASRSLSGSARSQAVRQANSLYEAAVLASNSIPRFSSTCSSK